MSTRLTVERCWHIECQRCANEDTCFEVGEDEARTEFAALGWADDFCPACNGAKA